MTPSQYIQNVGRLVLMWRPGKPPMLGARVSFGSAPSPGQRVTRQRLRRGIAFGRGQQFQTIPLFVGVPAITIPPKFDVDGIIKQVASEANIEKAYLKNLDEYQDPNGN
jgi:hypothetical protein